MTDNRIGPHENDDVRGNRRLALLKANVATSVTSLRAIVGFVG